MAKKRPSLTSSILSGKSSIKENSKERINERREQQQEEMAISEHIDGFLAVDDITVDSELEYTIRIQDEQEFDQFKKNLVEDGKIRDAIVVTKSFGGNTLLVDGHHRLKASKALQASYPVFAKIPVVYKDFLTRDELIIWMLTNQIGRRNLTKEERLHLALKLEQLGYFTKIAQENRGKRTDLQHRETYRPIEREVEKPKAKSALVDTHVAEIAQVSVADAKRMRRVKEESEDLYQQIVKGERSISNAYNQVRKGLIPVELQEISVAYEKSNLLKLLQNTKLLNDILLMVYNEVLELDEETPKLLFEKKYFKGVYGVDVFQALEINKQAPVFISYLLCLEVPALTTHFLENLKRNAHYSFVVTIPEQLNALESFLKEQSQQVGIIVLKEEQQPKLVSKSVYSELSQLEYISVLEKLLFWK